MPMKNEGDEWRVLEDDWGLISADTQRPINPLELISDEDIEMTDWELQDFAVQVVRNHIKDELDGEIMSSQSNPSV